MLMVAVKTNTYSFWFKFRYLKSVQQQIGRVATIGVKEKHSVGWLQYNNAKLLMLNPFRM